MQRYLLGGILLLAACADHSPTTVVDYCFTSVAFLPAPMPFIFTGDSLVITGRDVSYCKESKAAAVDWSQLDTTIVKLTTIDSVTALIKAKTAGTTEVYAAPRSDPQRGKIALRVDVFQKI